MQKKTRVLLLFIVMLATCGCVKKNQDYYDHVAETVISFYRSPNYDEKKIHKDDRQTLKNYLSTLTHTDQIIDVGQFIDKTLPSNENNSPELTVENGTCYMKYDDLKNKFIQFKRDDPESVISAYYTVTCNGYYAILEEDAFYPDYNETIKNPTFDYTLLKVLKTKEGYNYIYKSTYDGTGLSVELHLKNKKITEIITSPVDASIYLEN